MKKEIGKRIEFLRTQKQMTLEQVAAELNISRQRLSRIEKGVSDISIDLVNQIASVLDVDYKTILDVQVESPKIAYRSEHASVSAISEVNEMLDLFYANKHLYERMKED